MANERGEPNRNLDKNLKGLAEAAGPNYLDPKPPRLLTRRRALGALGVGGVLGAGLLAGREVFFDPVHNNRRRRRTRRETPPANQTTTPPTEPPTTAPPPPPALWSDPATWDGAIPGPGDVAVIDRPVILDIDTQVAGVQIEPTGELIYDPAVGHTLASSGNVVVHGTLRMRPVNAAVHHFLTFVGVNEGGFTGDHTEEVIDGDVGVWVMHAGVLDLVGTAKAAWTRLAAATTPGSAVLTVDDASGWQVGDEVVVTPTGPSAGDRSHWLSHDRRIVTALAGNQVSLDRPLEFDHPFVTVREGNVQRPEVLNLGRNVHIEGAPDARAHVIVLHATRPQAMGWLALRHMGPAGVLGRYAMHFHMCEDGVRGSTMDGIVAADCGNHSFVTHLSHGVTWRDCVAHDVFEDPYWWDLALPGEGDAEIPSNDVVYERCVAHLVRASEDSRHSTGGFLLGAGSGNVARGCVAVGVEGASRPSAGFNWAARSRDQNIWVFEDCVAHNNSQSGIYYWQNHANRTIVDRFVSYHNKHGIYAGAYNNLASYRDTTIYANEKEGLVIVAVPGGPAASAENVITYERMYVDQAGLSDFAVNIPDHLTEPDLPTIISNGFFKGGNKAQVGFDTAGNSSQLYQFIDCSFEGNAFWLGPGIPDSAQIQVVDNTHGSIMLHSDGGPGQRNTDWNGTTTPA